MTWKNSPHYRPFVRWPSDNPHKCRVKWRFGPLQWRHYSGVPNPQPDDRLLNCLFRCRSKKISKLRVTGLCAGNSPVTGEFPAQRARNAENVSIWWRHHLFFLVISRASCRDVLILIRSHCENVINSVLHFVVRYITGMNHKVLVLPCFVLPFYTFTGAEDIIWLPLNRTAWVLSSWWRHQMEAFSALLALCAGNSPVTGKFPTQRPMTRSFDVLFDLRLNKRLSKQSWCW